MSSFNKFLQQAISNRCQVLLKVCGKKSVVVLVALCYGTECCNMLHIFVLFSKKTAIFWLSVKCYSLLLDSLILVAVRLPSTHSFFKWNFDVNKPKRIFYQLSMCVWIIHFLCQVCWHKNPSVSVDLDIKFYYVWLSHYLWRHVAAISMGCWSILSFLYNKRDQSKENTLVC